MREILPLLIKERTKITHRAGVRCSWHRLPPSSGEVELPSLSHSWQYSALLPGDGALWWQRRVISFGPPELNSLLGFQMGEEPSRFCNCLAQSPHLYTRSRLVLVASGLFISLEC